MAGLNIISAIRMAHPMGALRSVTVPSVGITTRSGEMLSVVQQVNGNSLTDETEIGALQGSHLSIRVRNTLGEEVSAAWVVGRSEAVLRSMGIKVGLYLSPENPIEFPKPDRFDAINAIASRSALEIDAYLAECRYLQEISRVAPFSLVDQLGIEMIDIPTGEFIFQRFSGVPHQGFALAKTPLTNRHFQKLLELKPNELGQAVSDPEERLRRSLAVSAETSDEGKLDSPMVFINWNEAGRIAELIGLRLPTELEWERAGAFTDGRQYPWGNDFDSAKVTFNDKGTRSVFAHPQGASQEGIFDLAGNVWEWTGSYYGKIDLSNPARPVFLTEGDTIVLRGGAWGIRRPADLRGGCRSDDDPGLGSFFVGVRFARGLAQ